VVWFGFVAAMVCARVIGAGAWRPAWERLALGAVAAASTVGLGLAMTFGNLYHAYPYFTKSTDLTEPMLDQLSGPGVSGNVFNSYVLGAELIYRAYPRLRPSMDSRADSYGEAYFEMHRRLFADEAALTAFLTDFDVRYMLLTWDDFADVKTLPSVSKTWKMQFADHKAVLLTRR
jgi:hypothetical protein